MHPHDKPQCDAEDKRLEFGAPAVFATEDDACAVFETQAEYLERLNLWAPGEREAFARVPKETLRYEPYH